MQRIQSERGFGAMGDMHGEIGKGSGVGCDEAFGISIKASGFALVQSDQDLKPRDSRFPRPDVEYRKMEAEEVGIG